MPAPALAGPARPAAGSASRVSVAGSLRMPAPAAASSRLLGPPAGDRTPRPGLASACLIRLHPAPGPTVSTGRLPLPHPAADSVFLLALPWPIADSASPVTARVGMSLAALPLVQSRLMPTAPPTRASAPAAVPVCPAGSRSAQLRWPVG
ncbi:hypothetical protein ZWY2020_021919 [Hordeum vulgare]|nr:hypothetical protein ZWY2020_021919 [Hordeum vulgare]